MHFLPLADVLAGYHKLYGCLLCTSSCVILNPVICRVQFNSHGHTKALKTAYVLGPAD